VNAEDQWDEQLFQWSHGEAHVAWIFWITRGMIWLARRVLWVLMIAGNFFNCVLLRQMELDADRFETRLAGSEIFESTAKQLVVLSIAHRRSIDDLRGFYQEGRLGNDLPHLIMANIEQFDDKIIRKINDLVYA